MSKVQFKIVNRFGYFYQKVLERQTSVLFLAKIVKV